MKYKCLRSFAGMVCGTRGQVMEIKSKRIADDLLRAGYVEPVETESAPVKAAKATAKKAAEVKDAL